MIRTVEPRDIDAICGIYNHYIQHSVATFEVNPVSIAEMGKRVELVQQSGLPWLVMDVEGELTGYAYATQWKPREAYARTLETTVYLHKDHFRKGYGQQLYQALIELLTTSGYHALLGGIALPNSGSVALHEKMGFKKVAQLREVGYKFDQWIDVGYWELILR